MHYKKPICLKCKHFNQDLKSTKFDCAAYPDGIPEAIYTSQNDHTQPYPGDNGIRFEPIEKDTDNG
jgi:hypothetical protein